MAIETKLPPGAADRGDTDSALPSAPRAATTTSAAVVDAPDHDPVVAANRPAVSRPDPEWEAALARARWIARLGRRRRRPDGTREDWLEPAQRAELERRGRVRLAFYKAADAFAAREGRAPDKPEQRRLLAKVLLDDEMRPTRIMQGHALTQSDHEQAVSPVRRIPAAGEQEDDYKLLPDLRLTNTDLTRRRLTRSGFVGASPAAGPSNGVGRSGVAESLNVSEPFHASPSETENSRQLRAGEDLNSGNSVVDRRDEMGAEDGAAAPSNSTLTGLDAEESQDESVLSVDSIQFISLQAALRELDFDESGASNAFELIELIGLQRTWLARRSGYETLSHVETRFEEEIARATEHRLPARRVDAYRHAYWSFVMTRDFGAEIAKQVGDTHERRRPNPDGDLLMDLYNNRVGRELALDPRNHGRPAEQVIGEALEAGLLRLFPFDVYYGPE